MADNNVSEFVSLTGSYPLMNTPLPFLHNGRLCYSRWVWKGQAFEVDYTFTTSESSGSFLNGSSTTRISAKVGVQWIAEGKVDQELTVAGGKNWTKGESSTSHIKDIWTAPCSGYLTFYPTYRIVRVKIWVRDFLNGGWELLEDGYAINGANTPTPYINQGYNSNPGTSNSGSAGVQTGKKPKPDDPDSPPFKKPDPDDITTSTGGSSQGATATGGKSGG